MAGLTKKVALALALVTAQPQFANASLPPSNQMPVNLLPLSMRETTQQPDPIGDLITSLDTESPVAQSLLDWDALKAAANMDAVVLDSNDFMPDGTAYHELDISSQRQAIVTFTDWLSRNAPQFMRTLERSRITEQEVTALFDNALMTMSGMQGQGAFSIGNNQRSFCFLDVSAETQESPTITEGIDVLMRAAEGCNTTHRAVKMFGLENFKPRALTQVFGIARARGVGQTALDNYVTSALLQRPDGPAMFVTYYASLLGVNNLGTNPRLAKALELRTQRVLNRLTATPENARLQLMLRIANGPKGIEAAFAHTWLGNITESALEAEKYDRTRSIGYFVNRHDRVVPSAPTTPARLAPKR